MPLKSGSTWKRLLAFLLAWSMASALLPPVRAAEEAVPITIGTGIRANPTAQVEVPWDDAWFYEDASVYRHPLAMAAMALSGAAYINEKDAGIKDALEKLGFSHVKAYNYCPPIDAAADLTAYAFAVKSLPGRGGKPVKLVSIIVRGTGDYTEWASNLNMGSGASHQGFAKARDELLASLRQYLSDPEISGNPEEPLKFLVAGHSRGGAVANLAAAQLTAAQAAADVYAYTFASPAVSTEAVEEGYQNIFNLINQDDLVTQVPLAQWGCRRYGIDMVLPASGSEEYNACFAAMNQRFTALTGQAYTAYQDAEAVGEITSALYRLVPSTGGVNMAMLAALFSGDFDSLSGLAQQYGLAAVLLGRTALDVSYTLTPLLRQEADALVSAHCMAGYYCWLAAGCWASR